MEHKMLATRNELTCNLWQQDYRKLTITSLFCLWFLSFSFAQTGSIRGRVMNSKGLALQGITITLEPDKHSRQTNMRGEFMIEELYPGTYWLTACHSDYPTYTDSIKIYAGKAIEKVINLSNIQQLEEVLISKSTVEIESANQLLKLSRSGMPVQVITRHMIEQLGSRRLDQVLKEQTGMAIVNDLSGGNRSVGVQLQGFGSEYVMILIDGQPMVGRNNGNFDLSRISVSNVERIEIVKGASSCLFGSDALGGAINIITRYGAVEPLAHLALRYGTWQTIDATLDAESPLRNQRGSIQLNSNYYHTAGFNSNPYLSSGQSSPPYNSFDTQARFRYQAGRKTYIGTSMRYGIRRSDMEKNWGDSWQAKDKQNEQDLNYALYLDHTSRSGIRMIGRYYLTHYEVNQSNRWQQSNTISGALSFKQTVHRYEQQFAKSYRNGINLTAGLGGSIENMNDAAIIRLKKLNTAFAYMQADKRFFEKWDIRGGLRYDYTNAYAGKINPSLGMQYYLNEKVSIKAGMATGFKTPDYRMRYLVFFNPSASYLVIGSELLKETLQQMQTNGQISEIFHLADRLDKHLKPEKSRSMNLGLQFKPNNHITVNGSLFYHKLQNQIDAIPVASGIGISQIYSYRNLPQAVNKGLEANIQWQIHKDLNLQLGYQYLIAKDLSVADSIRKGNWPYNQNLHNPRTGEHQPLKVSDYWGIINRSRHMLNVRLFYHFKPWNTQLSIRTNYRGKYPFADDNNNDIIDRFDSFVPHHLLLNAFIEKKMLKERLMVSFSVENILDVTHQLMPGQPGCGFIAGLAYRLQR